MKEAFLHYLWRLRRFDLTCLKTTEGQLVEILNPGNHNYHDGPDFFNAQIKIDKTIWVGNIEIHLKSSDWIKHHHQKDKAYDNVILHVVFEEDVPIRAGENPRRIPCLELKDRIPPKLLSNYLRLLQSESWIPCAANLMEIDRFIINKCLERCMVERLQNKIKLITNTFIQNGNDWAKTFFIFLARGFGQKVNAEPFDLLARSFPLNLLAKHKNNLLQLEALLLGQAGFLELDFKEIYPQKLQREYQFLRDKYDLNPLDQSIWKFFKLRPANFPTIRLAQLATLCHQSDHLFSKIIAARNITEIEHMFKIKLSNYWKDHYRLDKPSSIKRIKQFGKTSIHLLIINTIVPFTFFYGDYKENENIKQKAIQLLRELPPEKNQILNKWDELGITAEDAMQSQALLELKNNYCDKRRCTDCSIGSKVLNRKLISYS